MDDESQASFLNLIVRQVQNGEAREAQQVLHLRNLVLMQVKALHARHVVHSRDLRDAIALQPD